MPPRMNSTRGTLERQFDKFGQSLSFARTDHVSYSRSLSKTSIAPLQFCCDRERRYPAPALLAKVTETSPGQERFAEPAFGKGFAPFSRKSRGPLPPRGRGGRVLTPARRADRSRRSENFYLGRGYPAWSHPEFFSGYGSDVTDGLLGL